MSVTVSPVVAALLSRYFWVTALGMMALGLWLPGDYVWARLLIPVFLGGILFFTGLKVPLTEVVAQIRPRNLLPLLLLTLVKLIGFGALGWAVGALIAPEWALGLALTLAMPAGLSSAAITDLSRGHVGFALVFTLITSLLAPLTIPLLVTVLDPTTRIEAGVLVERTIFIALLLGIPLSLAQVVRRVAPGFVQRHYHRWGPGAVLSSCLLIFVSIAGNRFAWESRPQAELLAPLGLAAVALFPVLLSGMALARWWRPGEGVAFGVCCLWMNNGLAVAFADKFYHGNAGVLLPAVLMQLPIIASVSVLKWWYGKRLDASDIRPGTTNVSSAEPPT